MSDRLNYTIEQVDEAIGSVVENSDKWSNKYDKPQEGIPATDMTEDVNLALGKAATALQSESDPTVPNWAKQPNKPSYTPQEVGALPADTHIPSMLNEMQEDTNHRTVTDDEKDDWNGKYKKPQGGIPASDLADNVIPDVSNFITNSVDNLVNYYLKSETYTKTEVQSLIDAVRQFTYEVVQTLPAASADTMHKIYLVPSADPLTQNVKDEYITIDNGAGAQTRYTWEQIGSTAIDLSGYYTSAQTDAAITAALNTALADYATKVTDATAGNLAGLDANGNITDSGVAPEDIPEFVEESTAEELKDEYAALRTDIYQALEDTQQVTSAATDAASLADTKAGLANSAATAANSAAALANEKAALANTKAGYAQEQGDYAKAQADACAALDLVEFVEDNTDTNPFSN